MATEGSIKYSSPIVYMIAITAIVFVLFLNDIAVLLYVHHVEQQAQKASASTIQLCDSINVERGHQITLWQHLLQLAVSSHPSNLTPSEEAARQREIASFRIFVGKMFSAEHCTSLSTANPEH